MTRLLDATLSSVVIIFAMIFIGLFVSLIQKIVVLLIAKLTTPRFTDIFMNKLTFIGVVHHEMSHLLFAILTGAKILSVHLFKPDEETDSLGSVSYAIRGPFLLRGLQAFLASIAPVICGSVSLFCMFYFVSFDIIWKYILFGFLGFCIFIHMDLSTADLKVAAKGLISIFIILMIANYATQFNAIDFIMDFLSKKGFI